MQINIESRIKNYSIGFYENFDFLSELTAIVPKVVIIDRNVWYYYENILSVYFEQKDVVLFDAIEANKTIENVLMLCDSVMATTAKKNMTLISFGGGIVQDVTGFLASILYRGIEWLFVPTTLLAQADSCMGSKTSLNYKQFKNLLGTFYPPTKVFINVAFTKTLKYADFYSGIGEVIKLHVMGRRLKTGVPLLEVDALDSNRDNIKFLTSLVNNSLAVKYSYIQTDEFDVGRRNLLNFGHCFGHAFEVSSSYAVPHGIAVVIGMIFANIIAVRRGLLSEKKADELIKTLFLVCVKCPLKQEYFDKESILKALQMDKKRIGNGLPLIVLQDNGELIKLLDMTSDELFMGIDEMYKLLK